MESHSDLIKRFFTASLFIVGMSICVGLPKGLLDSNWSVKYWIIGAGIGVVAAVVDARTRRPRLPWVLIGLSGGLLCWGALFCLDSDLILSFHLPGALIFVIAGLAVGYMADLRAN